ncbi:MAG: ABC transporter ATP-binding protein [Clostridium sp.]
MSLIVDNLVKKYDDKIVVDHLSFKLENPGVFALLGTNGAGKSTTIRILLNILSKDGGEIYWKGKKDNISRLNVGYLAEERGLYPKYEILDQLLYFAALKNVPKKQALDRIKYYGEKLEVIDYIFGGNGKKAKRADQLSKGNQQKIQLISALLPDSELLILDEPLSGLDPINTDLFKRVIRDEIKKEKYIIMSSHQMPVIEEFCEDILLLKNGQTRLKGNLNEIKKGYGRVNLFIKCEKDIDYLIKKFGIVIKTKTPEEYHLKISDEEQAYKLLNAIIEEKISLIKYELREPTLHDIFIEKVGK